MTSSSAGRTSCIASTCFRSAARTGSDETPVGWIAPARPLRHHAVHCLPCIPVADSGDPVCPWCDTPNFPRESSSEATHSTANSQTPYKEGKTVRPENLEWAMITPNSDVTFNF
ncbi:hypothetical protein ACFOY4_09285 [Actinomadura syzygii]|uniref:hypothetical protein n=1 Tax=Actinomadura syzygii TaxID=1427538 RepID=UPI003624353D